MFKNRNEKISRCLDSMKIAHANSKCADQPQHPCTLISAFEAKQVDLGLILGAEIGKMKSLDTSNLGKNI